MTCANDLCFMTLFQWSDKWSRQGFGHITYAVLVTQCDAWQGDVLCLHSVMGAAMPLVITSLPIEGTFVPLELPTPCAALSVHIFRLKFESFKKASDSEFYPGVLHCECCICSSDGPTSLIVCCYRQMACWWNRQTLAQELLKLIWARVTS